MENNLTNKAKFFALYYDQQILKVDNQNFTGLVSPDLAKVLNSYLELKPVSSITDEDALELIKIYGTDGGDKGYNLKVSRKSGLGVSFNFNRYGYLMSFMLLDKGGCINNYYERYPTHQHFTVLDVEGIDYLRSKSYALPFMGLSVKQQIEYGWIKLTSNEINTP